MGITPYTERHKYCENCEIGLRSWTPHYLSNLLACSMPKITMLSNSYQIVPIAPN